MDCSRPSIPFCAVPNFAYAAGLAVLLMMLSVSGAHAQTVTFTGAQSTIRSFDPSASLSPIAVNKAGDIFAVETVGSVRSLIKVQANGTRVVLNGNFPFSPHTIAVNTAGDTLYFLYAGATTCGTIAYEHLAKTTVTGNSAPAPIDLPCGFTFPQIAGWNASYIDPHDIKVDSAGNLFIADYGGGVIWKIPPTSNIPTEFITTTTQPYNMALSVDGASLYYTYMDCPSFPTCQYLLGRIPTSAFSSTIGGTPPTPTVITRNLTTMQSGLLIDRFNNIYVGGTITSGTYQGDSAIFRVALNGTLDAVTPPSPSSLNNFGIDYDGNLYTGGNDSGHPVISTTSFDGVGVGSRTVGSTSPAYPLQFVFSTGGTLGGISVVTEGEIGRDFANKGSGTCNTTAPFEANVTCTVDVTFTPSTTGLRKGAVVLKNSSGAIIARVFLYGTGLGPQLVFLPGKQSVVSSSLQSPSGLAVDISGNVYISDSTANTVSKATLSGGAYSQSGFATALNRPSGIAIDGAGNIYIANSGANSIVKATPSSTGYSLATAINGLNNPLGVAVDGSGNLYIANTGANQVLKETLSSSGFTASALATGLLSPSGVAVDGSGTVYIADSGNDRILKQTVSGTSYSSPAVVVDSTNALNNPTGIAVDGVGNIYVADKFNSRVLRVVPSGAGYSVATLADSTNGLGYASVIAVDGSGNAYVADSTNNNVLKITLAEPPSLAFSTTVLGSRSADSPKTAILTNVGNQALSFPASTTSYNPMIGQSYLLESSSTCAKLAPNAPADFVLDAGGTCNYAVSFAPAAYGSFDDWLTMNISPRYGTQTIGLVGIARSPISISPLSVPSGRYGSPYSIAFSATLGTAPYTYSLSSGTLPPGLALETGVLSGTPTSPGDYSIEITATDSLANTGYQAYLLTIAKATQQPVTVSVPTNGSYAQLGLLATASGGSGTGAYSYNATGSTACTVDASTGALTITSGAGTCSITAKRAGDSNYEEATSSAASVTISKASQAMVALTVPPAAFFGQTGLSATASGGSGTGAFSYNATGSTACSVNSTTGALTITSGTGTCSIAATRAADGNYAASTSSAGVVEIGKASQSGVTVTAPSAAFYAQTGLSATAAGGSGTGTYSYSATGSTACSVDAGTGALTITSGTGTCSITANRAADSNYELVTSSPATVTIGKATQAEIAVTAPGAAYYAQTGLSATAAGGSGTGAYNYGASGSTACSVDAGTGALNITSGTGTCSVTATRASDSNYLQGTSLAASVTISKATQATVSLTAPAAAYYAETGLNATASGGSGTGVYSYNASGSTACSVDASSGALTITSGTGTCSVTATRASDNNYSQAASSVAAVAVSKATQGTLTVAVPPSAAYAQTGLSAMASGGSGSGAYSYSAAGSTACAVDPISGALTITSGTGTCSITAERASDSNYDVATSLAAAVMINKATQAAVTVSAPATAVYAQTGKVVTASGGSGTGAYGYSAGGSTACAVDATSGALTITSGTGTCSVTAARASDNNYQQSDSSAPASVAISKAPQSALTVTAPVSAVYAQTGLSAVASGGNGAGLVTYSATGSTACAVDANSGALTITSGTGSCLVMATRAADADYLQRVAAAPAAIAISKAPASVTPIAITKIYDNDGGTDPTLTGSLSGFVVAEGITASYSRTPGETVAGSPYRISAVLSPSSALANYNITYNTGTFAVTPRPLTVAANNAGTTYNAALPALEGVLTGVVQGDSITATFTTNANVGSDAGEYSITATLNATPEVLSNYSVTNIPGALRISAAPNTQVVLNTSSVTNYHGQALTLTARVSNAAGTPTGSVQFMDGQTLLGTVSLSNGVATYTSSNLSAATHAITAVYSGSTNYVGATSNQLGQNVLSPTLSINGSATGTIDSISLAQGSSASRQFTLGSLGTLTSAVALSCSGLPAGLGCELSQSSVAPNNLPATVTVTVSSTKLRILGRNNSNRLAPLGWTVGMVLPGLVVMRRNRKLIVALLIALCFVMVFGMAACGSGNASGGITNGGDLTSAGTYFGTITATSTGATPVTTKFTVVLQ